MTEQSEITADDDSFNKRITSDSDPQVMQPGDRIDVRFHSQDELNLSQDTPRSFVVDSYSRKYNLFRETTPDTEHKVEILHLADKAISAANLYEPDVMLSGRRARHIAAAAAIVAAAGGLTLLAIKRRRQ